MFSDPTYNIEQLDLQSGMKVADLGCGSGFYSVAAARVVGGKGRVYAVDVEKNLLERLKKEAGAEEIHNIEVLWGDVEKAGGTKLHNNSIDATIVANLLFQIEHKNDFANEVKRILKPGGKLLVVDWNGSFGGMGPDAASVVTRKSARDIFEAIGFTHERDIRAGSHHWGMVLRKVKS